MQAEISPEVFYNEGVKEYEEGQYDLAIENFKKAIEMNDLKFDYHFNLGAAYMQTEEYDLAIESFNKCVEINPKDLDAFNNLGLAFFNKGEFDKAAKAYKKTVWINSADPENFNNTGIAYCAMENYKEAMNNFKHAVRIEPKDQNYIYNLAFASYGAKNYDLAEENLVIVVNYDKQREDAYLLLGKVYTKQKNYDLAKDILEKLLSLNPDQEEAQILLEKINSRKPCESILVGDEKEDQPKKKTQKQPQKQLQNEPQKEPKKELTESEKQAKLEIFLDSATKLLENKNYREAIVEFNKVLKYKADHLEAINGINLAKKRTKEVNSLFSEGLEHFRKQEFSQAIGCLEKALIVYPHSVKIQELKKQAVVENKKISQKYRESGQAEKAIESLKTSIDQNPDDAEAHLSLGNVYLEQAEYDLALDSLKNTLSLDPDNSNAKDAVFQVITELNSQSNEFENYMRLSGTCIANQDYSGAIEHIKEILKVDPNNSEAKTLLVKATEMSGKKK